MGNLSRLQIRDDVETNPHLLSKLLLSQTSLRPLGLEMESNVVDREEGSYPSNRSTGNSRSEVAANARIECSNGRPGRRATCSTILDATSLISF